MDMLDCFEDDANFPTQTVNIYSLTESYDASTGLPTQGYGFSETREVWLFQQAAAKGLFTDEIVDTLSGLLITDVSLASTDLVQYSNTWYNCTISDNILYAGQVVNVGLTKISQPDDITGLVEVDSVLGDSEGLV